MEKTHLNRIGFLWVGVVVGAILLTGGAQARTWTSADGTKTFEGELKSYDAESGQVSVTLPDGREMTFREDKLSAADIAWLKKPADDPAEPEDGDESPEVVPSEDAEGAFNPGDFTLSDLVEDVGADNHFKMPAKARPFLREVLDSGADVQFKTTTRGGVNAYISHDLSPNIWINPATPRERLGQAICHELLHFQDMKQFKPINAFKRNGLNADQLKIFQPVVGDLVNIISHEYVKKRLEKFGYVKPLSDNADGRMKTMTSGLDATEKALADVSEKLAKTPDRKTPLKMINLQAIYQNLMLMNLRDELLFDGAYEDDLDAQMERYQAVLDFMKQSTSEDPRFRKLHLQISEPAGAIRRRCKAFQASGGSTMERYILLADTLNHIYRQAGIKFGLTGKASEAPTLTVTSTTFRDGESFIFDAAFTFSKVRVFTPRPAGE